MRGSQLRRKLRRAEAGYYSGKSLQLRPRTFRRATLAFCVTLIGNSVSYYTFLLPSLLPPFPASSPFDPNKEPFAEG